MVRYTKKLKINKKTSNINNYRRESSTVFADYIGLVCSTIDTKSTSTNYIKLFIEITRL